MPIEEKIPDILIIIEDYQQPVVSKVTLETVNGIRKGARWYFQIDEKEVKHHLFKGRSATKRVC